MEYAPSAIQIGSPEFFRATLFHNEKNEIVLHADTDIAISKNGKELYKASSEFSQPFVHTPNGNSYFHLTNFQIQDNILLQRKYWE